MKATKHIATIVLAALATISSAPLVACHDGIYANQNSVREQHSMTEDAMGLKTGRATEAEPSGSVLNEPFEDELILELWMTEPFETRPMEEELVLEAWMAEPFEAVQDYEKTWNIERMAGPHGIGLSFNPDHLQITTHR